MKRIDDLPVYKDVFRLVSMLLDDMDHLAVKHRRVLGERVLNAAYDAIGLLHFAYGTHDARERVELLDRFLSTINLLKTYLRIVNERRLMSLRKLTNISELLVEITKQANGWKKYTKNGVPGP